MTSFIIIVVIALFIVAIGFSWYRLEAYEGMEKIIICVAGIITSWAITSILFNLSSNGLEYLNIDIKREVSEILILVFTPINGILIMPYTAKLMSQFKFDEIEGKDVAKSVLIFALILLVIFFLEVHYLESIQSEILNIGKL